MTRDIRAYITGFRGRDEGGSPPADCVQWREKYFTRDGGTHDVSGWYGEFDSVEAALGHLGTPLIICPCKYDEADYRFDRPRGEYYFPEPEDYDEWFPEDEDDE
jgi:hypothetical protein